MRGSYERLLDRFQTLHTQAIEARPTLADHIKPEHLAAQARLADQLVTQLCAAVEEPAVVLASPTGTGKTAIALAAALETLSATDRYDRIAVIAPNQRVRDRWRSEAISLLSEKPAVRITRRRTPHAGELTCTTIREVPAAPFQPGTLVVLDEAHRGTQNPKSETYRRLMRACADRAVVLVTATPYQLSTSGLVAMLTVNGSTTRAAELRPISQFAEQLRSYLSARADTEPPTAEELAALRDTATSSRRVIDHHLLRQSGGSATGLYRPAEQSIERVSFEGEWTTAYWTARALAALTQRGVGDALNRGLDSASETFFASQLASQLVSESRASSKLIGQLRARLGIGTDHPKVANTVEWVAQRAGSGHGRHVLVFSYFLESQAALARALSDRLGPDTVEAPTGSKIGKPLVERFRDSGAAPLVLVVTDRFSESIDLDGGGPCVVHHDLHWNPNRIRQRMGRVTRLSSGYQPVDPADVHIPVLDTPTDQRLWATVERRFALGDLLVPAEYETALEHLPPEIGEAILDAVTVDRAAMGSHP
jgi:superfamily II DNA or RNA helicase